MDRKDIITFFAAVVIVAGLAYMAPVLKGNPVEDATVNISSAPSVSPDITQVVIPEITENQTHYIEPFRIFYQDDYFDYPYYVLPDNLSSYGASDPTWKGQSITFAYINESRGGVTDNFSVPYPVWKVNCTITAKTTPQCAHFRMMVVSRQDGRILDAAEYSGPGNIYKLIYEESEDVYMVIGMEGADNYVIDLEIPERDYSHPHNILEEYLGDKN